MADSAIRWCHFIYDLYHKLGATSSDEQDTVLHSLFKKSGINLNHIQERSMEYKKKAYVEKEFTGK